MKILVIGSGFIATPVIERLQSEGHELLVYTRTPSVGIDCRQIQGDIFNFEEFLGVLAWKPQVIIHTAWVTIPGLYREDESNIRYAQFTIDLAEYVSFSDVEHLIVLGSCAEYGLQVGPSRAGVTALTPRSLYGIQKVIAFNSAMSSMQESQSRLTWARIFYPFGVSQHKDRLIPHLIKSVKNGETIELADTSSQYDWITTRDIASAISWVLQNNLPLAIDIGTSFGYTNLELLEIIVKLSGSKTELPMQQVDDLHAKEVCVVDKNSSLLGSGWLPKDSLLKGLEWVFNS
jgi:nucleoside-diphosphate-sugar epimerase